MLVEHPENVQLQAVALHPVVNATQDPITPGSESRKKRPVHEHLESRLPGATITQAASIFESERRQVSIDSLGADWIAANAGFPQSRARRTVKRLFDVTASA